MSDKGYKLWVIMSDMRNKLVRYLQEAMDARSWSQSELARNSGVNRQAISDIMTGRKNPSVEFCKSISKGLRVPPEKIFRMAGLLPPVPEATEQTEKLLFLFNKLDEQDKQTILDMVQFFADK